MHLICLGVMRKLLNLWSSGPLKCRVPSKILSQISTSFCQIAKFIPNEFGRKPRSLNYLKRFKATEFRQILLYTGPSIFKKYLPQNIYQHFLLLHCGTYILLSNSASDSQWNNMAKFLIDNFVSGMGSLYGRTSLVYNVHSLLHIHDDALNFGNLDNVSAFSFENFMQFLKKIVHGQKLHLEQLVNRISEFEAGCSKPTAPKYVKRFYPCNKLIVKITHKNFIVSTKKGNNTFLTKTNEIIRVLKIYEEDDNVKIQFNKYTRTNSVKCYPIESKSLEILCVA